jgi:hypothetical protein
MESYYELLMKELDAETPREAYEEVLRLKQTIKLREKECQVAMDNWATDIREINKRITEDYQNK